ncbi:hypothetical protein SNEBB_000281 [Seison nebaliae]|nr:hypothetical protein SNEBB_000281 [Seison nebaliae]
MVHKKRSGSHSADTLPTMSLSSSFTHYELRRREKSFILDGVAVSNMHRKKSPIMILPVKGTDQKLPLINPPKKSLFNDGYLQRRNRQGAGYSVSEVMGHEFMGAPKKAIDGFNGEFGYRRNNPILRKNPSDFGEITYSPLYKSDKQLMYTEGQARKNSYRIRVFVGDEDEMSENNELFLRIYDEYSKRKEFSLNRLMKEDDDMSQLFERDTVADFDYRTRHRLRHLKKIRLRLNCDDTMAALYVNLVEIQKDKKIYRFPIERWLNKEDGFETFATTKSSGGEEAPKEIVDYDIEIKTQDKFLSGTDGKVTVQLYNNKTSTLRMPLTKSLNHKNPFEKGQIDRFIVSGHRISNISKIVVELSDSQGKGGVWNFESALILVPKYAEKYQFMSPKKMDPKSTKDKKDIVHEIHNPRIDHAKKKIVYQVFIKTGDAIGSGTDNNAKLEIGGRHTNVKARMMLNENRTRTNTFENDNLDEFYVVGENVDEPTSVKLTSSGGGIGAKWFVEYVEIKIPKIEKIYKFEINDWLRETSAGTNKYEAFALSEAEKKRVQKEKEKNFVTYKIRVFTGDVNGAGTNSKVNMRIRGNMTSTDRIDLTQDNCDDGEDTDLFERNVTNTFTVKQKAVGQIAEITIGHDNKGSFSAWYLDSVVVECLETKEVKRFIAERWLDKSKGDQRTAIKLEAANLGKQMSYEVIVTTMDERNAGTDGDIYVILIGDKSRSEEISLNESSCINKKKSALFEKGKIDTFQIFSKKIGEIKNVTLGLKAKGIAAAWAFSSMKIKDLRNGKEYMFNEVNTWLNKKNHQIELEPTTEDENAMQYHVEVLTGDELGSGTDADVFLTLVGGKSEKKELLLSKVNLNLTQEIHDNLFEKNQTDYFMYSIKDLGNVKSAKLKFGEDGSKWYVKHVLVRNEKTKIEKLFEFDQWLDEKAIECSATPTDCEETEYKVIVATGDESGAGTDSEVYIRLCGNEGISKKIVLKSDKSGLFERNCTDEFTIKTLKLSDIKKIIVGHNGSGIGAKWLFHYIKLSRSDWSTDKLFKELQWIEKKDGLAEVEVKETQRTIAKMATYDVKVKTGDDTGAGTDSKVYIILHGLKENSERLFLSKDNLKNKTKLFENDELNQFTISAPEFKSVKAISMGHDGKGFGASWQLEYVELKQEKWKEYSRYEFNEWIKEKDGKCEMRVNKMEKKSNLGKYTVTVITSEKTGSGTDSNVKVKLISGKKMSDFIELSKEYTIEPKNKNILESGNKDIFVVESEQFSNLTELIVTHDGKGFGSDWDLETIQIEGKFMKNKNLFRFNRCIDGKKEEKAEVEIIENKKTTKETIVVKTGDVTGAGTDSEVYVKLIGDKDTTDEIMLTKENVIQSKEMKNINLFENDKIDSFSIDVIEIGKLKELIVGYKKKGFGAKWYVDYVEYKKDKFKFEKWIEEKKGKCEEIGVLEQKMGDYLYKVQVKTGNVTGAGTDSNVKLLDTVQSKNKNLFENDQLDEFHIYSDELGDIKGIEIVQEKKGLGAKWNVNYITIIDGKKKNEYKFEIEDWITEKFQKDYVKPIEGIVYELDIMTGNVMGAGTDSGVCVTLFNGSKKSSTIQLVKKVAITTNDNLFEKNMIDTFKFTAEEIGEISDISLKIDGKGMGSKWHVAYCKLRWKTQENTFLFDCWIEDEKKISKTLDDSTKGIDPYVVTIVTGNENGAGTDSNVYIIIGNNSKKLYSEKIQLNKSCQISKYKNLFEQNQIDKFKIFAKSVSPITTIKIGTDGKGFGANWFVTNVDIDHKGTMTSFYFNDWIEETNGKIETEFYNSSTKKYDLELKLKNYNLDDGLPTAVIVTEKKLIETGKLVKKNNEIFTKLLTLDDISFQHSKIGEALSVKVTNEEHNSNWSVENVHLTDLITNNNYKSDKSAASINGTATVKF